MPGPLTGLVPACYSPFHADGRLHVEVVDRQVELLRESRISSVFVGGTTGEFASLTVAERKVLVDRWVQSGGSMKVAVHVGHNCQADAIERLARSEGLDRLVLETGDRHPEAWRLYERGGFSRCGPVLDYPDSPWSVFYEKSLVAADAPVARLDQDGGHMAVRA